MKLLQTSITAPSAFLVAVMILVGSPAPSDASVTISYPFAGGSQAASVTGTDAPKVSADPFAASGVAGFSGTSNMAFLSMGATGSDLAAALADSNYFSVTLSATNPGEFQDLDSLALDFGGSTNSGAATINLVVQSSVGGFGTGNPTLTVTPSSNTIVGGSGSELTGATVDVSSSAFDSLSTVTFQFRFFDDDNTGNSYDRMDNVEFQGAIVPEPSSVALLMGLLSILGLRMRRWKGAA